MDLDIKESGAVCILKLKGRLVGGDAVAQFESAFQQTLSSGHLFLVLDLEALEGRGMGSNIELFSYQSPDQKVVQPKNSDIGGYHIAFYVDDIKAATDYLRAKNVKTMMGPIPITEGPAAGQAIVYFNAPWGLQLEAISYPKGMAYEKDAKSLLWMTTEPMK